MKMLGLIGGMSWESTAHYYKCLNRMVAARCGGWHSARLILHSLEFHEVAERQHAGDWEGAGQILADAGRALERAGAEALLICANTMHCVASDVETAVNIPLLHIADATAVDVRARGLKRVGLLGTRFTMEMPFYRDRLAQRFGIETLTPGAPERRRLHDIIFEELVKGVISTAARTDFIAIMDALHARGAEGMILGCTEFSMLVTANDYSLPLFDTAELHCRAAVDWALAV